MSLRRVVVNMDGGDFKSLAEFYNALQRNMILGVAGIISGIVTACVAYSSFTATKTNVSPRYEMLAVGLVVTIISIASLIPTGAAMERVRQFSRIQNRLTALARLDSDQARGESILNQANRLTGKKRDDHISDLFELLDYRCLDGFAIRTYLNGNHQVVVNGNTGVRVLREVFTRSYESLSKEAELDMRVIEILDSLFERMRRQVHMGGAIDESFISHVLFVMRSERGNMLRERMAFDSKKEGGGSQ